MGFLRLLLGFSSFFLYLCKSLCLGLFSLLLSLKTLFLNLCQGLNTGLFRLSCSLFRPLTFFLSPKPFLFRQTFRFRSFLTLFLYLSLGRLFCKLSLFFRTFSFLFYLKQCIKLSLFRLCLSFKTGPLCL